MKNRKLLVFAVNFVAFTSIAVIQSLKGNDAQFSQLMMLANGVVYIGGNVLNTFVTSRFFVADLAKK